MNNPQANLPFDPALYGAKAGQGPSIPFAQK